METLTIKPEVVAKILGTSQPIIKAAIKNGTLPIGFVARPEGSSHDRIVIIKKRFEIWLDGGDLEFQKYLERTKS